VLSGNKVSRAYSLKKGEFYCFTVTVRVSRLTVRDGLVVRSSFSDRVGMKLLDVERMCGIMSGSRRVGTATKETATAK